MEIIICGDKKKTKTNRQTDGHMSGVIHRGAKLLEKINKKASLQMDLKGGGTLGCLSQKNIIFLVDVRNCPATAAPPPLPPPSFC